ncbi:hypothetical protein GCM10010912_19820 [Paenibacillus albidus]|uniref:SLH domain-containing protein n=1 Tax=Paenibacillus albidus TaxID=2041023 RepID=A0A917C9U1_9BACL|nr:S-layer homology domain-containing protein [Paenibacillus albidus]GGF74611.1 hypothetical protein GCM10010912_19820 [Paenibacillus albidus]
MITYSARAVSAVLAGALAFGGGGAVFALEPAAGAQTTKPGAATSAASGIFSDVKTGFWAEKHIYKLASQGIIVGNNGLFRPGDSVTQQEAVLMALRFMKIQDKVNSETMVALPEEFVVSNYFKNYVVLAFQQGLLDKTTEMAADNLKTPWGERKATREWIAEMLVRSLGKNADAAAYATEPTGFADDAKVSANKRGVINLAVKLGLANGLDGNRFDPQGAVTRAQLATFFSRAEAQTTLEYDNTIKGTVSALADGKLTLYAGGSSSVYNLGANTAYFTSASETRINLSDIQPHTKVTVIGATYSPVYVEVTDPVQQVESLSGNFAMVAPGNKIWLKSATGFTEYTYDEATTFVDVNGDKIDPAALVADSTVTLQRETYTGAHKVVSVQVTSGIINKTASGTIQSVDLTGKSITFKNAAGKEETFKWEDGTSLFRTQSSVLLPADLKTGAAVKYTVQDNMIRSVEVTEGIERTVQGTLNEMTKSSVVYKKADGTREVKLLGTAPVIVIPNMAVPVIDDLIADPVGGDNIQLTLNSSDQVTKIEVLKRQIEQLDGAAVVDYNAKTQLLTVKDSSGKPHVFLLDDKTKLIYDGVSPVLSSVGARLTQNRKVNVKGIGERAISLEVVTKYEGTLTEVNTNARHMVIKVSDGQSLTLSYPQAVDMFGVLNPTITDVPIGSPITAILSGSQDVVQVLKARMVTQLEAATVNSGTNKIGVKWSGGVSEINTQAIPLTNEAGQAVKLTELVSGEFINVTFDGTTPLSVQFVKRTAGQVAAVDAASGTLSVKDYAGAVQNFTASAGVKIIRDGTTTTALGNVTTADRVEVRKDANGALIINVLSQANRIFWRYETTTSELLVKRANLNDNNYRFRVSPNAYIHQGDTTLSVQSLKENDNIVLYINNGIIVEIVKQ